MSVRRWALDVSAAEAAARPLYVGRPVSCCYVRATRKLGKLFSLDALQSLSEHAARWTHPVSAKKIRATIDQAALDELRKKYPRHPDSPQINQFEDAEFWIKPNLKRVQDLWLDRSQPMRVLDLGCGSGFFLYICKLFGHDVLGVDRDTNPLFRGMMELLKVSRVVVDIEPYVALPDLGPPFDVITAYRICFQRIRSGQKGVWKEWGPNEWKFFLNDVRSRFLKPDGRILLDFNPRDDGTYYDQDVKDYFRSEGARFFRSKVLFAAERQGHARFNQIRVGGEVDDSAVSR